ncbi:MAG: hypothetical protein P8X90_08165 [Desulfobacterales bacterium]|jgi:hypothetical protein
MGHSANLFMIMIVLGLSFLAALRIQAYMMKRAVSQVVDRFRSNHCLCSQGAKSADELGLQPPNFWQRLYKPRDYKPDALRILIQSGAVRLSKDDKMCLLEKKLQNFPATRANPGA